MSDKRFNFIIPYLKKESILIDFAEFKFQAETHPDFPSLYAFSDTLNFFNIDNLAVKISKNDIGHLPEKFVALLKLDKKRPFLSFVERTEKGYKYSDDVNEKMLGEEEFLEIWQEIVLVIEKTDRTTNLKPKNRKKVWLFGLVFIILLLFSMRFFDYPSWQPISLLLLGTAGVYLSIEALYQSYGRTSNFSDAVCNSSSQQSSNCNSIITSKNAIKILNLGMSDFSIIFFSGHLISLILFGIIGELSQFINYSFILLILTVPFSIYSIYYQSQIEKKWCSICLMIIAILTFETTIYSLFQNLNLSTFNFQTVSLFIFGLSTSFIGWVILKPILNNYFDLQMSEISLLRFKRNDRLFKLALQNSTKYDYSSLKSSIFVGNPNAALKLTVITSPFCGHCVKAQQLIDRILTKYSKDVLVNIRFNCNLENAMNLSKDLHFKFLEIYFELGQNKLMEAMNEWYENKDEAWFIKYGKPDVNNLKNQDILKIHYEQNRANELLFTPAIIVGSYLYPNIYNNEDLIGFISELINEVETPEQSTIQDYNEMLV